MDKLKSALSRDKEGEQETTGATGRLTGQGSHFSQAKDSAGYSLGGPESAFSTDASKQGELGSTVPAQDTTATVGTVGLGEQSRTTADTGSAAVGSTSTYSSHYLSKGDPNPSIVDRSSADPTTYQTPEKSMDTGVPAGSATAAATAAFNNSGEGENMPGAYPSDGSENPYRTDNLDPRVDDLASRPKDTSASTGAGMATAAAGVATAEAAHTSHEATGPAPSSLTDTTNPADRSTELGKAEQDRGLAAATTTDSSQQSQPGMVGKVLGAVGLGSLAGGAVASQTSKGDESAVADTADQPTTVTGTTSSTAPTESKPPAHYRKESIPTTAYPGGIDSPAATAPPVGGTQPTEQESHTGRDAALGGVAAGGAAVGTAAAVGTHEHQEQSKATPAPATGTGGLAYDDVTSSKPAETARTEEPTDHSKRDTALAGAAGVGAAGAGAYGVSEYEKHKAEEEAAKTSTTPQKEHNKLHKSDDQTAKAVEKEEKKQQKEAEKQSKKERRTSAAAEAEQRKREEDERLGKASAAALGTGAGAGAGAAAYEAMKDEKVTEEKEKKPSIFKRLFKRTRKNKDTGEDEDYESEHEDDTHKGAGVAAGAAGVGAAGAGAAALSQDKDATPTKYEESTGGLQKPSYNPFSKDDPKLSDTAEQGRTGEAIPHSTATTKTTENVGPDGKPIEPLTGMPYDPAKDPAAAERLAQHQLGTETTGGDIGALKEEHAAEGKRRESLGDKLKHSLGVSDKEHRERQASKDLQEGSQLTMQTL